MASGSCSHRGVEAGRLRNCQLQGVPLYERCSGPGRGLSLLRSCQRGTMLGFLVASETRLPLHFCCFTLLVHHIETCFFVQEHTATKRSDANCVFLFAE